MFHTSPEVFQYTIYGLMAVALMVVLWAYWRFG